MLVQAGEGIALGPELNDNASFTAGTSFEVGNLRAPDAVVQIAIQAAPSGYTSTKKARDGKCQRVKVKMAKVKGLPLKATFRTCY